MPFTPVVMPVLAGTKPCTPVPAVEPEKPATPNVGPVDDEAEPIMPAPCDDVLLPTTPMARPFGAVDVPLSTPPLVPGPVTVRPGLVAVVQAWPTWSWSARATVAAAPLPPKATPRLTAPVAEPPVRPLPAAVVTAVMSPPLSLSTSSANPAGLPRMPDQGAVAPNSAFGAGVSVCRDGSVVNAPVDAPGRTPISSQRALPVNVDAPKSSATVKRPFATAMSSYVSVVKTCAPPAGASKSLISRSYAPVAGDPLSTTRPWYVNAVP